MEKNSIRVVVPTLISGNDKSFFFELSESHWEISTFFSASSWYLFSRCSRNFKSCRVLEYFLGVFFSSFHTYLSLVRFFVNEVMSWQAALAVWITILRFMGDLPEPKYITSQPDVKVKLHKDLCIGTISHRIVQWTIRIDGFEQCVESLDKFFWDFFPTVKEFQFS